MSRAQQTPPILTPVSAAALLAGDPPQPVDFIIGGLPVAGGAIPAPRYPQALFPDRPDHRAEARSDVDASLAGHQTWIEEGRMEKNGVSSRIVTSRQPT